MDGQNVFRFALKRVPEVVEELLGKLDIEKERVDLSQEWRDDLERGVLRCGAYERDDALLYSTK